MYPLQSAAREQVHCTVWKSSVQMQLSSQCHTSVMWCTSYTNIHTTISTVHLLRPHLFWNDFQKTLFLQELGTVWKCSIKDSCALSRCNLHTQARVPFSMSHVSGVVEEVRIHACCTQDPWTLGSTFTLLKDITQTTSDAFFQPIVTAFSFYISMSVVIYANPWTLVQTFELLQFLAFSELTSCL